MAFIFGGDTGETPESIKRKRELAAALGERALARTPRNLGEGLGTVGQTIASLLMDAGARKREKAGREAFVNRWGDVFSGGGGGSAGGGQMGEAVAMRGGQTSPAAASIPAGDLPSSTGPFTDEDIERIIKAESNNDPNAVSEKGAGGLMQIMPDTWDDPGYGVEPGAPGMRMDATANRDFGVRYLNAMAEEFGGDKRAALAAYNWGPGNVKKYGSGSDVMPAETNTYLAKLAPVWQGGGAPPEAAPPDGTMAMAAPQGGAPAMPPTAAPMAGRAPGGAPTQMATPASFPGLPEGVDPRLLGIMTDPWARPGEVAVAKAMFDAQLSRGKPSAAEEQISRLMSTGLDRSTAIGIADGRLRIDRHPVTGVAQIVDMASGQVLGKAPPQTADPATVGAPAEGERTAGPEGTLYDTTDEATGLVPALKAGATSVFGQIPGMESLTFPDTVEIRQNYAVATNDLIRSLSVNPRFPVAEMQRIEKELGIAPEILQSGTDLRAKMRSTDRYLRGRLADEQAAAVDESLPPDQRGAAMQSARAIERFLTILGVPQGRLGEEQGGGGATPAPAQDAGPPPNYDSLPRVNSAEAWEALPSGAQFVDPEGNVRRKP